MIHKMKTTREVQRQDIGQTASAQLALSIAETFNKVL